MAKMLELFAAQSSAGYPNWNPTTHPYRVAVRVPCQWSRYKDITAVFATEPEARTAFEATGPRGTMSVTLDFAENQETWTTNGRWTRIDRRGPRGR